MPLPSTKYERLGRLDDFVGEVEDYRSIAATIIARFQVITAANQ